MNYEGLDFDREELSRAMSAYYDDIIAFITTDAFQTIFAEMMALPPHQRPAFVQDVWLDEDERSRRGLVVPDGILVQTSAFGDRRPTLFVVKKFLPEKYHVAWENVNWTFNNDFNEEDVPNDPESSWRLPLSVAAQNGLLANNVDLQSVPDYDEAMSQPLDRGDIERSQKIA